MDVDGYRTSLVILNYKRSFIDLLYILLIGVVVIEQTFTKTIHILIYNLIKRK